MRKSTWPRFALNTLAIRAEMELHRDWEDK